MGIFKKIKALFHEDWCTKCQSKMDKISEQTFILPMTVGHYVSHREAEYYKNNLIKVDSKKDIPAGVHASIIKKYRCPKCGHNIVLVSNFLPVRNEEKLEETILYEKGELDSFIDSNNNY